VPSIPGTGSQGETIEEAVSNTKEAIGLMLDYLRERGEERPKPRDIVVKVSIPA
jgi:predicted RNase H-like HicB family nuclease